MDDDAFDALVEESFQLAELVKHPGWRYLQAHVDRTTDALRRRVLGGALEEGAYKALTGELFGIERVISIPLKVNEQLRSVKESRAGG